MHPTIDRRRFLGAGIAAASLPALGGQEAPAVDPERPGRTPHTRFALNVEMWFTDRPFLERIDAAAALGFPAVEFWPWQGKDLDAIAAVTERLGIEVAQFLAWGFAPGLNDPANHDRFLEAIAAGCAAAKRLRCRQMTVIAGDDRPGVSPAEMHAQVAAGLKRAAPLAAAEDVMLILEPLNVRVDHKGHCLSGSPAALRICREVASPHVKINWDLYHMQITEGDLCGRLREGFDQLGYVQLADHPGRHEPGTGEIRYNRVLKELHDLGYRGHVGLECTPSGSPLEAARAVARADAW